MCVETNEITYNSEWNNSEQDVINVYSLWMKSQVWIPKEFETFHFTCLTVDILNKMEELNSELHCRVYSKRKWKELKTTQTIMQA